MDLIKCPICGEMYSPSYRHCPFCEEEDRPRKAARRGHHVSEKKRTHSARGPITAVLLVVLVVMSWYLFGDRFMEKVKENRRNEVETVDPAPIDPTPVDPTPVDPTPVDPAPVDPTPDDPTPDEPAPPVVEPEPEPATPTVDTASLSMKTNVGSLQKDVNGRYDCTIKASESIKLIVKGTDAAVSWSSADSSIVTVGADGLLKPAKVGTTTVTASVGGATLECIVRVK